MAAQVARAGARADHGRLPGRGGGGRDGREPETGDASSGRAVHEETGRHRPQAAGSARREAGE